MTEFQRLIKINETFKAEMGAEGVDRLPLSWVTLFLLIADKNTEGILLDELATMTDSTLGSVSRAMKILSAAPFIERGAQRGGHQLVVLERDAVYRHRARVFLADKGKRLAERVLKTLAK